MKNGAPRVGLLHTIVRREEKLLRSELELRGAEVVMIPDRQFSCHTAKLDDLEAVDVLLCRSMSQWRNVYAAHLWATAGVPCVNPATVIDACGDKLRTTLSLQQHNVPHIPAGVAFTSEAALELKDSLGYPLVVKPLQGSWGRLIGKINDRDAAETILDHKEAIGSAPHSAIYVQAFVDKGPRDIRAFVIGSQCVAAIFRTGEHWKTNTALGATASGCEVTNDMADISLRAAKAMGGGALAVDLFEGADGYLVNEVNGTMEFKNSIEPTGVNIPGLLAEYVIANAHTTTGTDGTLDPVKDPPIRA